MKEVSRSFFAAFAMFAVSVSACGGGGDRGGDAAKAGESAKSAAPAARETYDPSAPAGALRGRVSYTGKPAATRTVRMSADPYCDRANPGGAVVARFDVSADGGLAGAVVYITGGLPDLDYPLPASVAALDQIACNYVPRVLAVRVGQGIEIRNGDATLHNVHAMPEQSRGFNLGMPREGMTAIRKFAKPEVFVRIKCDVHPWMQAHVAVLDHPFFAVTDKDGRYRIDGIPPGKYEVEAVHPVLGSRKQSIEITAPSDGDPKKEAQAEFGFEGVIAR